MNGTRYGLEIVELMELLGDAIFSCGEGNDDEGMVYDRGAKRESEREGRGGTGRRKKRMVTNVSTTLGVMEQDMMETKGKKKQKVRRIENEKENKTGMDE